MDVKHSLKAWVSMAWLWGVAVCLSHLIARSQWEVLKPLEHVLMQNCGPILSSLSLSGMQTLAPKCTFTMKYHPHQKHKPLWSYGLETPELWTKVIFSLYKVSHLGTLLQHHKTASHKELPLDGFMHDLTLL